jgi:tetratricopeptide (TPR) repeat protein
MQALALSLTLVLAAAAAVTAPRDPDTLLLDSAATWEQQGRPDLARLALEKFLAANPGHPQASLLLGDLEIRSARIEAAHQVLANLRHHNPSHPAVRELAETLRVQTRDRLQLATMRRLAETSRFAEAAAAARALYPEGPPPGPLGDEYRKIMAAADIAAAPQAPAASDRGASPDTADPRSPLRLSQRWEDVAARRAETLSAEAETALTAGRTGEALRKLEEAQTLRPDDPWARYRLARLYADIGLGDEARRLAAEGVTRNPKDVDARFAQALLLSRLDDRAAALEVLDQIPKKQRSENILALAESLQFAQTEAAALRASQQGDPETARSLLRDLQQRAATNPERLEGVVGTWLQLGELDEARSTATVLAQRYPGSREALLADARILRAEGRDNAAMRGFTRVRDLEQRAGFEGYSAAAAAIESISRQRDGWFAMAPNYHDKSGDEGISAYRARALTVEWRQPVAYEDHFFLVLDRVEAQSGTLAADFDSAERFGTVRAAGPGALPAISASGSQEAQGLAAGFGWETDHWRVDLGSTPLGFPVENWVGGVRWSDRIGAWSATINLARRPVTGSLLSYAGVRDPVSGRIWGGVTSTGADTRLARDYGRLGVAASAGAYRLDGRNVPGNDHQTLRLAADWDVVRRDHQRLEAGLALSAWRYDQNLGEYSFGHGGYYSPQRYLSAAVPVEWSGRGQRTAWLLRATASVSRTHTDGQVYYPGDPVLQSQAEQSAGPAPRYAGGSGGGSGVSVRGAIERQFGRHCTAGAGFDIERSEFYTPNSFNVWLRYDLDGREQAIDYPPRAPRPYATY